MVGCIIPRLFKQTENQDTAVWLFVCQFLPKWSQDMIPDFSGFSCEVQINPCLMPTPPENSTSIPTVPYLPFWILTKPKTSPLMSYGCAVP